MSFENIYNILPVEVRAKISAILINDLENYPTEDLLEKVRRYKIKEDGVAGRIDEYGVGPDCLPTKEGLELFDNLSAYVFLKKIVLENLISYLQNNPERIEEIEDDILEDLPVQTKYKC